MGFRHHPLAAVALAGIAALGAATPAAAQTDLERLSIHGYLTQGLVRASDLAIFGIGTRTTADYRNAALQFRYAVSDADNLVLQFAHRRLGGSVLTAGGEDVVVDWAFYQRKFGRAAVRVGRTPLPMGIYNETRDVGTLLPFYRAPGHFYHEGIETIDGVVGSYARGLGDWSAEVSAYYGGLGFEIPLATPVGSTLISDRVEGVLGGQLWIETPIEGLRVGSSLQTWTDPVYGGPEERQHAWQASVDGNFDRFLTRAEYISMDVASLRMDSYYVQGGVKLTERLGVYLQSEIVEATPLLPMRMPSMRMAEDLAASVTFAASSNLVLKLEGHRAEGYNFDSYIAPTAAPGRTTYGIFSVSTSF
jgi:hypothetical protein